VKFCKVCRHGLKGRQVKFCSPRCTDIARAFKRRPKPRRCKVCYKWILHGKYCGKECNQLQYKFDRAQAHLTRVIKMINRKLIKTKRSMRPKVWKI